MATTPIKYGNWTLDDLKKGAQWVNPAPYEDINGNMIHQVGQPGWIDYTFSPLWDVDKSAYSNTSEGDWNYNRNAVSQALVEGGYKPFEAVDPGDRSFIWRWIEGPNGEVAVQPQRIKVTDPHFQYGSIAASLLAGGAAAAANAAATAGAAGAGAAGAGTGAGAAGAGAGAAGGLGGATNMALIESALGTTGYGASSAGLGGAAGGLGTGIAANALTDPLSAYMSTGGVEGSIVGGGTGGGAGSVGAGSLGTGVASSVAPNLNATNPALIESAAGTPGYGASSAGAGNAATIAEGGLGMTGTQTSVYDKVLSLTGSPELANTAANAVGAGSSVLDSIPSLPSGATSGLGSVMPDWLKAILAAAGGYAAYKDAQKPQLQGYTGSIPQTTATKSVEQGKYGPISRVRYGSAAGGVIPSGIAALSQSQPRYIGNASDGMADGINAHIDGQQPAALSGGEFVIPADIVSHLGNGNSNAGAKQLYAMMDRIRQARTGTKEQGRQINPNTFTPR